MIIDRYLQDYPKDEGGVGTSVKAMLLASTGKTAEAEAAIRRAEEIGHDFGHFHHTAFNIASAYACDVSDEAAIEATIANLQHDMGTPSVLVHNAVGGAWGSFQDIDPKVLNRNFQVNTMALLHLARRLCLEVTARWRSLVEPRARTGLGKLLELELAQ